MGSPPKGWEPQGGWESYTRAASLLQAANVPGCEVNPSSLWQAAARLPVLAAPNLGGRRMVWPLALDFWPRAQLIGQGRFLHTPTAQPCCYLVPLGSRMPPACRRGAAVAQTEACRGCLAPGQHPTCCVLCCWNPAMGMAEGTWPRAACPARPLVPLPGQGGKCWGQRGCQALPSPCSAPLGFGVRRNGSSFAFAYFSLPAKPRPCFLLL